MEGGSTPWRMAMATFITPATPAAASVWPKFVLALPSSSGEALSRPRPSTAPRAVASMGSPRMVPVP